MTFEVWLGRHIKSFYLKRIERLPDQRGRHAADQSAIVFAPHQDDETLGCGGTLLLKQKAGAEIRIVFMTDGRTSHSQFMPENELIQIREQEALAAGSKLGIGKEMITFLRFRDGELHNFHDQAAQKVLAILQEHQPEQVFIPYRGDNQPDHLATNQIVRSVLQSAKIQTMVYEYPVWFWFHWPWIPIWQRSRRMTKNAVVNTLRAGFGLKLMKDFQDTVTIDTVLAEKRSALDQYKSQVTQMIPDPAWPTLSNFDGGNFLACFFQKKEVFLHYSMLGKTENDQTSK